MNAHLVAVLAFALALGCQSDRAPGGRAAPRPAAAAQAALSTAPASASGLCPAPAGGLRLALDSVAGMPAGLPVSELRKRCASARPDSVFYAGFASPALRFDFAGGTVWAVQNQPNTDTLIPAQPAEHWAAVGDSLRFPDGRVIPRRLGQLRAHDSLGVMSINAGDNTEGAQVDLCRVPGLFFRFDTLPSPADTTTLPFSRIGVKDTSAYRLIEQYRDSAILHAVARSCRRARVT